MVQKVKKWLVYGEWHGLYWFHSSYIYGHYEALEKNTGYKIENQVWQFKDDIQSAYFSEDEWNKISRQFFNQVKENPELLDKFLEKIEVAADDLFRFNKKIRKINFQKISWTELVKIFADFHKYNYNLWCVGMVPNLLELNNNLLSAYLTNYLDGKRKNNQPKAQELFQKLTTPLEWSYNQKEEYDFLKLVAKYQKNKELVSQIASISDLKEVQKVLQKDFKDCWQDLIKHHQEYYWLQFTWTGPPFKTDYFVDIFRRLLKEGGLAQKSAIMKKEHDELKSVKKDWFDKLAVDDYYQKLFELMTGIVHTKIVRMDALFQSYCFIEPLLKRAAKEFNVSMKQIYAIYCGDLVRILEKKEFPIELANKILKHSTYSIAGGKFVLSTGKQAEVIMKPILESMPKQEEVHELSGECGCPGQAKGTVKVISVPDEISKMREGDVMVSQITNPSLVPAMKKASAIITDTGGLTCHAAIVSREMNTPCLIGTKIATKVLKDGDKVEVDATKGVVRKLEK